MNIPQAAWLYVFPTRRSYGFWSDTFLIPAYVALCLLIFQILTTLPRFRESEGSKSVSKPSVQPIQGQGFVNKTKQHIRAQATSIVLLDILRLLGTVALVSLTATALLITKGSHRAAPTNFQLSEQQSRESSYIRPYESHTNTATPDNSVEVVHLVIYSYSTLLALLALLSRQQWSSLAKIHLTLIMLVFMAVYAYRDLYPLATFTFAPIDGAQGWLLWSRLAIISMVAVFIPLFTPRTYRPFDPSNPSKDVNPEQTACWASFLTFSFLDPIIWRAARTPHLEYESLPPLADYDRAEYLVSKSEQVLDPFLRGKRRHLFWGLLQYFVWEHVRLAIMIVLMVCGNFMAPIGVNRLLNYIQTGGKDSIVRPWLWILWLFLGPTISSTSLQYYYFLTTRTSIRAEGILTQLIFDHSLRIRMKEESQPSNSTASSTNTSGIRPEAECLGGSEDLSILDGSRDSDGASTLSSGQTAGRRATQAKGKATHGSLSTSAYDGNIEAPKTSNLVGMINNFVTTDLGNITDGRDFLFVILYGPLQVGICIWFLYEVLGWSALVGLIVMIMTIPIPGYIAKYVNRFQSERMKKTDARVQSVTEVLSVIRMTKLFGWEAKMNEKITEKREQELGWIKKRQLLNIASLDLNFFCPFLTMLVTYATYTIIQKKTLTAPVIFSSVAVFDIMREVLHNTILTFPAIINAKIALNRINDFLLNAELLDQFALQQDQGNSTVDPSRNIAPNAIGFRDASFTWNKSSNEDFSLTRRHFRLTIEGDLFFRPGMINVIIGPTGSGKTSLLMALLGEMHYEPNGITAGFNLPRDGGVAYAAQESWVQSETIKENILFGKPYDRERYNKVVYQCGLERDLSLFEDGDATEVGERGLTLSGGQKARITLARAVYSDARVLLLDDILAALDVHTSKFIVEECLRGELLKDRTTILVTHNVGMVMPIANFVVSLGSDGRAVSKETMIDALATNPRLLGTEKAVDTVDTEKRDKPAVKLVVAEEIALGHVGWPAFKLYFSSLGGFPFWAVFLFSVAAAELGYSGSLWFLGYWAMQHTGYHAASAAYYLMMYTIIILFVMAMYSVALVVFTFGSIRASRSLHQRLITSIFGATLRWLDTVPTARIITRCTQDIRAVDGPVSQYLLDTIDYSVMLLVKLTAVIFFVPVFVFPIIMVCMIGSLCAHLYLKAQLSVKREMSNRRSPVVAHFGAAIGGLTSLRAYGAQAAFRAESMRRINDYTRSARTFWNCNRWIAVRINVVGSMFAAGLGAYLVYGKQRIAAGNSGFALTMAIEFSNFILWWIRIVNEFEVQGNSLERIEDYINIEREPKPTESGKPPAYWPASGALKVENLSARYSANSPEVLRNISFEIKSGERVGVVGRTGSGKSSLTLSLLRCIPTKGCVMLDGLRTDSINVDALRSNITIIPQQPELLSGTLRENLDPFSEHPDATLNDALRAAGLFNIQEENGLSALTLDSSIASGGSNVSVGQRQIIALARAIVRRSKLLILDEATSAIDYATDTIIQSTLRDEFKDATQLTVAHRLQTIMDADKIIVLDAGNMVEFDSPANLLKKDGGFFKLLVDQSEDREKLYEMAYRAGKEGAF